MGRDDAHVATIHFAFSETIKCLKSMFSEIEKHSYDIFKSWVFFLILFLLNSI